MNRPGHVTTGPYAPPAPRERRTVTSADGSRIHLEVHGPKDAPAVVLAHGWTCSTAFWAPVVRDLAADHRVIAYDQRGHGRTPPPASGVYSTDALADDLLAVLADTLAPGERAVLAGHSMGGMTMMAAADRPEFAERAAAVLLCSTGSADLAEDSRVIPLRSARGRRAVHRAVLGASAPLGPVTPLGTRVLRYVTMGPHATPEMTEACARIVHACPTTVRSRWGKVLGGLELTGGAGRLTAPTAVIAGSADRLTPPVHARRLASVLPALLDLTMLPGLGHMTPMEDPARVAGRVRDLVHDHLTTPKAPTAKAPTAKAGAAAANGRDAEEKTA